MAEDIKQYIAVKIQKTRQGNSGFSITGHLEERFTYGMSAEYQQPYANTLQDLVNRTPLSFLTKTTPIIAPWMTASYWQGSETQDMQITIVLEAKSDPLTEVRQPIIDLLSLVAPSTTTEMNLLMSPIPQWRMSDEEKKEFIKEATETTVKLGIVATQTAKDMAAATAAAKDMPLEEMKDKISEVVNSAVDTASGVVDSITEGFSKVTDTIMNNSIVSSIKKGYDYATEQIGSLVDTATEYANGAVNSVTGAIGGLLGTNGEASGLGGGAASDIAGAASSKVITGNPEPQVNAAAATSPQAKPPTTNDFLMSRLDTVVSIQIGEYMLFPCVVVTNVTTNILNQIDAYTGWPMSAEVTISFRPFFTQAYGDVVALFLDQKKPAQTAKDENITDKTVESSMSPVDTLVSSVTSNITAPIKNAAKSITSAATDVANQATQKVSAMVGSVSDKVSKSIDNILPW